VNLLGGQIKVKGQGHQAEINAVADNAPFVGRGHYNFRKNSFMHQYCFVRNNKISTLLYNNCQLLGLFANG